jgi:Natural resistance-associated macrophage protein
VHLANFRVYPLFSQPPGLSFPPCPGFTVPTPPRHVYASLLLPVKLAASGALLLKIGQLIVLLIHEQRAVFLERATREPRPTIHDFILHSPMLQRMLHYCVVNLRTCAVAGATGSAGCPRSCVALVYGSSPFVATRTGTYSSVGAQFGHAMLWTMPLIYPFMTAQEISARLGRVTGRGIGGSASLIDNGRCLDV